MASNQKANFAELINDSRKNIQDSFKRSHEALQIRERILLSRIDQIEDDYNKNTKEIQELLESLNNIKSISSNTLKSNKVTDTREGVITLINSKITELTTETDSFIEFKWDYLFEKDIEQLGNIKLNDQTNIPPTRNFSPQVKPVIPDYKAKQLPTNYCCKKSSSLKSPGELNNSRCIAVDYKTENIYVADMANNRIQVFTCNGDYLFMFSEKVCFPVGICISENNVFVAQHGSSCVCEYELDGKLVKSAGAQGSGELQFSSPHGLTTSARTNNLYICDYNNNRVQVLTQDLEFHSMLGIGLFSKPRDVKISRDRVLVLDSSDPCIFVFNSNHKLMNRLITHGSDKQVVCSYSFDIDREYNIIMSDYTNHCVYVFNQEGEQIHKFGKNGQGIGEFVNPFGIVLDNTGHIIVVCQKDTGCLQFF
ncbi:Cell surface protein [Oopsacas minuta]|uniref:Cell surface protein n=1 Tax=Oopsacas minuta TaxID=111878 RepID=A0AAV7JG91_9METZ|nr:Cell surface protein [Oopsacas minuta]